MFGLVHLFVYVVPSVLLAFWSPCLGKRELVFVLIVHLFVSYANFNLCHIFSSSWCRGLAATFACGSSWTFLITYLIWHIEFLIKIGIVLMIFPLLFSCSTRILLWHQHVWFRGKHQKPLKRQKKTPTMRSYVTLRSTKSLRHYWYSKKPLLIKRKQNKKNKQTKNINNNKKTNKQKTKQTKQTKKKQKQQQQQQQTKQNKTKQQ